MAKAEATLSKPNKTVILAKVSESESVFQRPCPRARDSQPALISSLLFFYIQLDDFKGVVTAAINNTLHSKMALVDDP